MAIDLNDKTGNGNTLTNDGAAEITSSLPYSGSKTAVDLELDETDFLYAADSTSLSITGDLTIELWVKWESLPSEGGISYLVCKYAAGAGNAQYAFYVYNNSGTYELSLFYSDDGTNTDAHHIDITTPNTGTWYHYAAVVDVSEHSVEFFVDGSSVGTHNTGTRTAIFDGNEDVYLGSITGGTANYLDGQIDDVRIWNDKRSSAEISANKSSNLTGTEANLVAYWPFESLEVQSGYIHISS